MIVLTKSEAVILREIDSVPDKIVRYSLLQQTARRSAGLTSVGFGRVAERMIGRNLIGRDGDSLTLTFGGMRAMRDNGMEVS